MAAISAQSVKELRNKTGAGMMDCKKALADAGGDGEKAGELLRERGLAKAVKREGRETSEGAIGMAISGGVGALVELGCETDFVAKNEKFQALATSLAEAVLADASLGSADALLAAEVDGEKVEARIQSAIGTIGENIVAKRVARLEGDLVGGYVHAGGKLGVLVALEGVGGEPVQALARDLAMHVAAADPSPLAVDRDGFSDAVTAAIASHPLIEIVRGEVESLPPREWRRAIRDRATGNRDSPRFVPCITPDQSFRQQSNRTARLARGAIRRGQISALPSTAPTN